MKIFLKFENILRYMETGTFKHYGAVLWEKLQNEKNHYQHLKFDPVILFDDGCFSLM